MSQDEVRQAATEAFNDISQRLDWSLDMKEDRWLHDYLLRFATTQRHEEAIAYRDKVARTLQLDHTALTMFSKTDIIAALDAADFHDSTAQALEGRGKNESANS